MRLVHIAALAVCLAHVRQSLAQDTNDEGYSLTVPPRVFVGSNIIVQFTAPDAHWRTDWIGIFEDESSCEADCLLSWHRVPSGHEGKVQLADPQMDTPGSYVAKYCSRISPFITCHATSQPISVTRYPDSLARNPVVLLPGIGGSILQTTDLETNQSSRLWIILNELSDPPPQTLFTNHLRCLYSRSTHTCSETDPRYPVTPLPGLDGVRVLDPDVVFGRNGVTEGLWYFEDLVRMLKMNGWTPHHTLVAHPYDWRQTSSHPHTLSTLHNTITHLHTTSNLPVTVIAHSMGGMVLSAYLARYGEEAVRMLGPVFTAGTPFQGAGSMPTHAFLHGYAFGNLAVSDISARESVTQFPSVYELLPYAGHVWGGGEPVVQFQDVDGNTQRVGPSTLPLTLFSALKHQTAVFRYGDDDYRALPSPLRRDLCDDAAKQHAVWNTLSEMPAMRRVRYHNIHGHSHPTTHSLHQHSSSGGGVAAEGLTGQKMDFVFGDGDGTVLTDSSTAPHLTPLSSLGVADTHQALVKNGHVMHFVMERLVEEATLAGISVDGDGVGDDVSDGDDDGVGVGGVGGVGEVSGDVDVDDNENGDVDVDDEGDVFIPSAHHISNANTNHHHHGDSHHVETPTHRDDDNNDGYDDGHGDEDRSWVTPLNQTKWATLSGFRDVGDNKMGCVSNLVAMGGFVAVCGALFVKLQRHRRVENGVLVQGLLVESCHDEE